jgi:predicted ATPase
MGFRPQLVNFVSLLRDRLGPQLHNVPLLYHGAPELREILALFEISLDTPTETLTTDELRARFQSLVEQVFSVLAEIRPVVVFLDDIHEADPS